MWRSFFEDERRLPTRLTFWTIFSKAMMNGSDRITEVGRICFFLVVLAYCISVALFSFTFPP